jgi:uncharacterized protein
VAASALVNLAGHARARTVKWPCAIVFAVAGVTGAASGSARKRLLAVIFSAVVALVGLYVTARGLARLL